LSPILLADKAYVFWVKARNTVGLSAFSDPINIHSAQYPGEPGAPFRMSTTTQSQISVGWSNNPSDDFGGSRLLTYEVWWNQGSSINQFELYNSVPANIHSQTVAPVQESEIYDFYIIATNIIGSSGPSATV
jgi:hypothetical protein